MQLTTTTFAAVLMCIVSLTRGRQEWSYDESSPTGPSRWKETYPECGGQSQSPIDFFGSVTEPLPGPTSFKFTNYDRVQAGPPFIISNTGHTVMVQVNLKDITVSGGGLPSTYALEQLHLHWGEEASIGSEHRLGSVTRPMEVHLVHYNRDLYPDVATAAASGDPNALAVLGVSFEIDDANPTPEIGNIINSVKSIPYKDSSTFMAPFNLANLLPQSTIGRYFRYNGSLTTPGCSEVVVWTLFAEPMNVTNVQLAELRHLRRNAFGEPDVLMTFNYRPVQPINSRTVYRAN